MWSCRCHLKSHIAELIFIVATGHVKPHKKLLLHFLQSDSSISKMCKTCKNAAIALVDIRAWAKEACINSIICWQVCRTLFKGYRGTANKDNLDQYNFDLKDPHCGTLFFNLAGYNFEMGLKEGGGVSKMRRAVTNAIDRYVRDIEDVTLEELRRALAAATLQDMKGAYKSSSTLPSPVGTCLI
ncbi:hypothetical protein PENTCL1PPCAC_24558, partial [Pristionchus entomophagus]